MAGMGIGSGLAVLGFWLFIAAVVVAGIWYGIREREAQHETLRRMMESGQAIDKALMETLLPSAKGTGKRLDRDLKVGGLIVLFAALGLALLGWLIGTQYADWLLPLLGVAALTACVALGLLVTSHFAGRWQREDDSAAPAPPGT